MTQTFNDQDEILNSSLYQKEYFDIENIISNDTSLKIGIVTAVLEIGNKDNKRGTCPEYHVRTIEQKGGKNILGTSYSNCIQMTIFGGSGDFFEYKLRERTVKTKNTNDLKNQLGSMVILLCLDGSIDKGIILGSCHNSSRKSTLTKENGIHLEGEYNGLNWKIDKDGALTVTFKSATDNKGNPANKGYGGTTVGITKEGSFEISDNTDSYIKMDKPSQFVSIKAGSDMAINADSDMSVSSGGNTDILAGGNLGLTAGLEGSVIQNSLDWKVSTLGQSQIDSVGPVKISSSAQMLIDGGISLDITAGLDIKMEATLITIKAQQIALGGLGGVPAALSTSLVVGFAGPIPVIGFLAPPYSTSVFIK